MRAVADDATLIDTADANGDQCSRAKRTTLHREIGPYLLSMAQMATLIWHDSRSCRASTLAIARGGHPGAASKYPAG